MSYGSFCERGNPPAEEQVVQAIGGSNKFWNEIHSYLSGAGAKPAWKFYGKNYGWALAFTKSGKSVISLYPLPEDFTVQMIIKPSHEAEIRKTADNREFLALLHETPEIHEGKWIFIPFSRLQSTELVKKLIDIKLKSS